MNFRSILTEPSKPAHPAYRYGMLVLILGLLAWNIQLYLSLPSGYDGDPYGGFVVVLVLLFNHLAFAFKWPRRITTAIWVLAMGWLVFGFFYILYWLHVLHSVHMPGAN